MADRRVDLADGTLVDLLDRLLDTGAVLEGTILITLADVDLVRLDLRALLASVETLRPPEGAAEVVRPRSAPPCPRRSGHDVRAARGAATAVRSNPTDSRLSVSPGPRVHRHAELRGAEHDAFGWHARPRDRQPGMAGLVVALVDIVRQLLERQAIRRMEAGSLDPRQTERLGQALRGLQEQTTELVEALGLHTGRGADTAEMLGTVRADSTSEGDRA